MGIQPDQPGAILAGRQDGKMAVADSCLGGNCILFLDSLNKDAVYFEKAGLQYRHTYNIQGKCGHIALQHDFTRFAKHGRKMVHS